MSLIAFYVTGEPKGQPRPRAFAMKINGKYQARVFDAGTAENWKSLVAIAATPYLPQTPFLGPIKLSLTFKMPRPKSHYRSGKNSSELKPSAPIWYLSKPDTDNLAKAIMDALTVLGMWKDDSQICNQTIAKLYADTNPGVLVQIEPFEQGFGEILTS